MLLGIIVLMCETLRRQPITLLVFLLHFIVVITAQTQRDHAMKFSGDFESFLRDLGSMVYKSKKIPSDFPPPNGEVRLYYTTTYPTTRVRIHRRSETPYKDPSGRENQNAHLFFKSFTNTQKAALRDVLMMKLVSYYEDKYKLVHSESTTTEGITFMRTFTTPLWNQQDNNNRYNEVEDVQKYSTPQLRRRTVEPRNNRRNFDDIPFIPQAASALAPAPAVPEVVII